MQKPSYLELLAKYGINGAHPGGMELTVKLLKNTTIDSNTHILDVGCGTGQTSAFIAKKYCCHVTAVDVNEEMLNKSYDRFKKEELNVILQKANAEELPFAPRSFDILLSESVTAFTNINKALKEYNRVLKPLGTLIAIEITSTSKLDSRDMSNIKNVYNIDRILTNEEWIRALNEAGFNSIEIIRVAAKPTNMITSARMLKDFLPHIRILQCYRQKLEYSAFICKIQ